MVEGVGLMYGVTVRKELMMTVGNLEVARRIAAYEATSPMRYSRHQGIYPASTAVIDLRTGFVV